MIEQALNPRDTDLFALSLIGDRFDKKWSGRLELLQRRINDENYLRAAIQRLALVLSNEIMEITMEGGSHERQRKRRK